MTDTDRCFPLSSYLSACCFHASIVATKDKETHWSSKNLKIVSFQETQTLQKKRRKYTKEKKGGSTVNVVVSPSSYCCYLVAHEACL